MSILSHHLLNIGAKMRHLLPAQPCLLCGAVRARGLCCADCRADLPKLPASRCPVCALPGAALTCGRCLRHPPAYDHTLAAFPYAFPVDRLIQALKFEERLAVADFLAEELAQCVTERPTALIPMPLHPARLRQRGHNQSLLLARGLASRLHLPVLHAVERIRDTPPQTSLNWRQRQRNLRRAFRCQQSLAGQHVAIVDDVMTSGSSLHELARELKRCGALRVDAWVVARTLPGHKTIWQRAPAISG